jgi:hypothetical protein
MCTGSRTRLLLHPWKAGIIDSVNHWNFAAADHLATVVVTNPLDQNLAHSTQNRLLVQVVVLTHLGKPQISVTAVGSDAVIIRRRGMSPWDHPDV